MSASVCREAVSPACVAPGATRPPPLGRQVALLALPPLEPPAGPGGRLKGEEQTPVKKGWLAFIILLYVTSAVCLCLMYRIPCNCHWWGSQVRRGGVPHSGGGHVIGLHLYPSSFLKVRTDKNITLEDTCLTD